MKKPSAIIASALLLTMAALACNKDNPDAGSLEGTWEVTILTDASRGSVWDSASNQYKAIGFYCKPLPADDHLDNLGYKWFTVKIHRKSKHNYTEIVWLGCGPNDSVSNLFRIYERNDSLVLGYKWKLQYLDTAANKLVPVLFINDFVVKRNKQNEMTGYVIGVSTSGVECKWPYEHIRMLSITGITMRKVKD